MRHARLLGLVLALVAVPAAADSRFYLQQEEVRGPDRPLSVGVRGEAAKLHFTVYRAEDPVAFLTAAADVHHLVVEGSPLRSALNHAIAAAKVAEPAVHGPVAEPTGPAERFSFVLHATKDGPWNTEAEGLEAAPYPVVELGRVEAGLYLVEAREGNLVAYCLAIVSDLALVVRREEKGILAYAVDRRSGLPRPGAKVLAAANGRGVASAEAGSDGLARLDLAYRPRYRVLASAGAEVAIADPAHYPSSVDEVVGYLVTDRPLYLPGETVRFSGFFRDRRSGSYSAPEGWQGPLEFRVLDASKEEVARGTAPALSDGSLEGSFAAPAGKSLGGWRLVVSAAGRGYGTDFRVEEFEKPTFRVDVSPGAPALVAGSKIEFAVSAELYAGGRVEQGTVQWRLYRSRFHQPLFRTTGLASFYSKGEYQSFKAEEVATGQAELGREPLALQFDTEWTAHPHHYRLDVSVADASRKWASGSGSVAVHPAPVRLDVRADRELYRVEETMTLRIRAVDLEDRPAATAFQAKVVRRGRKYPAGGNAAGWQPGRLSRDRTAPETPDETLLVRDGATDERGEATLELPVPAAGEIEVEIRAGESERAAVARAIVWASAGGEPVPYGGDTVRIVLDAATYRIGEVARAMVLLPVEGVAPLVTVEADGIVLASTERAEGNVRTFEIPVTAAMVPNAFVRVTAVKGGGVAEGSRSLVVPPAERVLSIECRWDRPAYRPGQDASVELRVTDAGGKPVETGLIVAVVDEALFALASDSLPPLVTFFHPLRRENVGGGASIVFRSYDHARVTERLPAEALPGKGDEKSAANGATEGALEERARDAPRPAERNGHGGGGAPPPGADSSPEAGESEDAEKKKENAAEPETPIAARTRFETTAFWQAAVRTGPDGTARITIRMPENLTGWRLTARAVDPSARIGEVRSTVATRSPIMLRLSAPRYLIAGDRTAVRAVARNATGAALPSLAVRLGAAAETFEAVEDGADRVLAHEVRAGAPGPIELRAEARGGEDADAVVQSVDVLAHGLRSARGLAGHLTDPRTEIDSLTLPASADPATARLVVRITPSYLAALEQALPYLAGYPYGCTEQTMSRLGPDLAAERARRLLGRPTVREAAELAKFVAAGLARLYQLQHEDRGWGWWEKDATDAFMTAYVLEGLLQAQALETVVDADRLERGLARLEAIAADESRPYHDRAYAASVLARAKRLDVRQLDRLFDRQERDDAPALVRAYLLEALVALHRKKEADHVAKTLRDEATTGAVWGEAGSTRRETDAVEVTARVARALLAHEPESDLVRAALDGLLGARSGERWRSTRDTAAVAHALADFLAVRKAAGAVETQVTVRVGDEAKTISTGATAASMALEFAPGRVSIETERPEGLFWSAHLTWFDRAEPLPAAESGFRVARRWFRVLDGGRVETLEETFAPGDLVLVEIEVSTDVARDHVLVVDRRIASADPIREDRDLTAAGRPEPRDADHRQFDRSETAFFLTRLEPGTAVLRYFFRPTLAGSYHALPASAELLYYPEVRGHSAEAILEVR